MSITEARDQQKGISQFWERSPATAGLLLAGPTIVVLATLPEHLVAPASALILAGAAGVYLGFAFMSGVILHIIVDLIGFVLFAGAALIGLSGAVWVIPLSLALHALWDGIHHRALGGAPTWYPTACAFFDISVAAWIAWQLYA